MSLVVGRLYSGRGFRGSAWMVSPDLVLTAWHCVVDDSGAILPDLNIKFAGIDGKIEVDSKLLNRDLDTALLTVTSPHDLSSLVITFNRRNLKTGDAVIAYGHAEAFQTDYSDGFPLELNIVEPDILIRGAKRTDLSYHGGPPPDIHGMSGGPVVLAGEKKYAVGMIISGHFDGEKVHAVSIKNHLLAIDDLVEKFTESSHVDNSSKVLLIDQAESGEITWSCSVSPAETALLMDQTSPVKEVVCLANFSGLRVAGHALKRLFWHGAFSVIKCHDADRHLGILESYHQKIEELPQEIPQWSAPPDSYPFEDQPNIPISMSEDEFSQIINNSLNRDILKQLDLKIEECDANDTRRKQLIGCIPEAALWQKMFSLWQAWRQELEIDDILNHQYLIHCLLATACNDVSIKNSLFVGRKIGIERLLMPTITALALAASDINTEPNASCVGNIRVQGHPGHACGIERFNGGNCLYAANNPWKTKVVILPFLQTAFLSLWEARSPMNGNPLSTPRLNDPGIPPLVVTGEPAWQDALSGGETMVKDYYNQRLAEIKVIEDRQEIGSRDGGMENA